MVTSHPFFLHLRFLCVEVPPQVIGSVCVGGGSSYEARTSDAKIIWVPGSIQHL